MALGKDSDSYFKQAPIKKQFSYTVAVLYIIHIVQIFLIGNGSFVFQNILNEDQYILHAFQPIFDALSPLQMKYFQNM